MEQFSTWNRNTDRRTNKQVERRRDRDHFLSLFMRGHKNKICLRNTDPKSQGQQRMLLLKVLFWATFCKPHIILQPCFMYMVRKLIVRQVIWLRYALSALDRYPIVTKQFVCCPRHLALSLTASYSFYCDLNENIKTHWGNKANLKKPEKFEKLSWLTVGVLSLGHIFIGLIYFPLF